MPDVLIRDVPDGVIAALDARASRLGLSRSGFLRRRLAQEAAVDPEPVTVEHLAAFAETLADLTEAAVMQAHGSDRPAHRYLRPGRLVTNPDVGQVFPATEGVPYRS